MFTDPIKTTEDFEKIRGVVDGAVGYQITVTCLQSGGKLHHSVFTNNFKTADMILSHTICGELISELHIKQTEAND